MFLTERLGAITYTLVTIDFFNQIP